MSKCLVLFVEGDTEVEFYKQVIANARKLRPNGMFDTNIECKSINGVGGFKNIVLRKFVKEIKTKYEEDCVFTVVLCRDTDVFELSPKPPIKWNEVERDLRASGAADVIHVKARHDLLGYITRYKNETIARLMDCGKKFIAIVDEPREETNDKKHRNAPTERGVPVSVYMVEE